MTVLLATTIELNPLGWVAFGVSTVAMIVCALRIPVFWKVEADRYTSVPPWWPYGDALWRAGARSVVTGTLLWLVWTVLIIVGLSVQIEENRPLAIAWLTVFAASLVIWLAVGIFGRPRSLVPPALRTA